MMVESITEEGVDGSSYQPQRSDRREDEPSDCSN